MRNLLTATLFASTLALAACGGTATPPAAPMAPAPGPAADNGQPKMQAAMEALQHAQQETTAAEANKGGHREKALELIQKAIDATNAGMQYTTAHASEEGAPEGPAEPEPVDEEVKGAKGQPHMASAVVALREARKQLRGARHDKGGFRDQALAFSQQAIDQLKEGIRFTDHHE